MALNIEDIQKLGELARLEIEPSEVHELEDKLARIVELVDQLKAVQTDSVEPMAHPLDRSQRLREDVVTERDGHELYQKNAPLVERGLYLVPKVIE